MMEAAMTVKRYSAFPKTITSNPKSHFVFGVLPIAHLIDVPNASYAENFIASFGLESCP